MDVQLLRQRLLPSAAPTPGPAPSSAPPAPPQPEPPAEVERGRRSIASRAPDLSALRHQLAPRSTPFSNGEWRAQPLGRSRGGAVSAQASPRALRSAQLGGSIDLPREARRAERMMPRSAAQVSATMERLGKAPVEQTIREAEALLRRLGFDTLLAGEVRRQGYRFRVADEQESRAAAITYPHDPSDIPGRDVPAGQPGRPTIALSEPLLYNLRAFVATGGRGFEWSGLDRSELDPGRARSVVSALDTLFHEYTHVHLHALLETRPAWATVEIERIQREHGVNAERAKLLLQESCGYYIESRMAVWTAAMSKLQHGEPAEKVRDFVVSEQKMVREQTVLAFAAGHGFRDHLGPVARRVLDQLVPGISDHAMTELAP